MVFEPLVLSVAVSRLAADVDAVLQPELRLAWDAKDELETLKSMLSTIAAVLIDANEQRIHSRAMENWLQKLKQATEDANNLFKSFFPGIDNDYGTFRVRSFNLPFRFPFSYIPARDIRSIRVRFENIANERKFHLNVLGNEPTVVYDEETDSTLPQTDIYGREEDVEKIVELLIKDTCEDPISIIPVSGMKGIGKTTLVKAVFNDERVEKHFCDGLRMWVWVSAKCDARKVTKKIIQSITKKTSNLNVEGEDLDLHDTQQLLQNTLKDKMFLLVLDNMWDETEMWFTLKKWLEVGEKGSKVIVTTSNKRFAENMGATNHYRLRGVSENACWSIFERKAFEGRRSMDKEPIFIELGWKIAEKSRGVPMAANALGMLMQKKRDSKEWRAIKNSEIWSLTEKENQILHALRSCYKHLQPCSVSCLAYCSIFPRDYVIEKEKIIKLWIANDLITSVGVKQLEDVGHEVFNDLLCSFFFRDVQKDGDGHVTTFRLHSLIYDLARSEMHSECAIAVSGQAGNPYGGVRHLCCDVRTSQKIPREVSNAHSTRTFLLLNPDQSFISDVPSSLFSSFRFLRVLDLSFTSTPNLLKCGNLHLLRYLDISGTDIAELPPAFTQLKYLQTFIARNCPMLSKIPEAVNKMASLRHLDITECKSLRRMPTRIRELHSLQTLPTYIVGKKKECGIGELGPLNLRGKLHITCLENNSNIDDEMEPILEGKEHLTSLVLSWGTHENTNSTDENLLETLKPHGHLERLCIEGYQGVRYPSWFTESSLKNLVGLIINNCRRCEHLPPLGDLLSLKYLTIGGMDAVKHIGSTLYGSNSERAVFPSLLELTCQNMNNLKTWDPQSKSEAREFFPNLIKLTIKGCPKLSDLPHLPALKHLGCEKSSWLKKIKSSRKGLPKKPNILKHLEITGCPKIQSFKELENLHVLETIKISQCEGLVSLPDALANMTSLISLELDSCFNMKSLPEKGLEGLHSLESLLILECYNLNSMSEGLPYLTKLRTMTIQGCQNLVSFPKGMDQLFNLQKLSICNCTNLTSAVPYLPALEHLQINCCPGLTASLDWLTNFKLLRSLVIEGCNNFSCLPSGLERMSSLEYLQIRSCHGLTGIPDLRSLHHIEISDCELLEQNPARVRHQSHTKVIINSSAQLKREEMVSNSKRSTTSDGTNSRYSSDRRNVKISSTSVQMGCHSKLPGWLFQKVFFPAQRIQASKSKPKCKSQADT